MIKRIESPALLVRSVPYGEADVVATFFTLTIGKVSAIVRGARRSTKRFGGALEPIHELFVTLEDRGRELCTLKEARVAVPRLGIVGDLDAMETAGRALRWVRHLCPFRTPEEEAWRSLGVLLGRLDVAGGGAVGPALLAVFGLELLQSVGYGLELERCVRCGKACPPSRPAFLDAASGGLVCMSCGGARRTIAAEVRVAALHVLALLRSEASAQAADRLTRDHANELLAVVEEVMAAHADFDHGRP